MPTAPDAAMKTYITNIEMLTGKTIEQLAEAARDGGAKHGERRKFVQEAFGLTYGYANYVALQSFESAASVSTDDDPAAAQYTGPKAVLRPIYEAVAEAARGFGDDVEFAPKKTYVSLRRTKQFGCIMPATSTRVDVGLILKGVEPGGRLEASTDAMFTHRVKVADLSGVDAELLGWLRTAYDAA